MAIFHLAGDELAITKIKGSFKKEIIGSNQIITAIFSVAEHKKFYEANGGELNRYKTRGDIPQWTHILATHILATHIDTEL